MITPNKFLGSIGRIPSLGIMIGVEGRLSSFELSHWFTNESATGVELL